MLESKNTFCELMNKCAVKNIPDIDFYPGNSAVMFYPDSTRAIFLHPLMRKVQHLITICDLSASLRFRNIRQQRAHAGCQQPMPICSHQVITCQYPDVEEKPPDHTCSNQPVNMASTTSNSASQLSADGYIAHQPLPACLQEKAGRLSIPAPPQFSLKITVHRSIRRVMGSRCTNKEVDAHMPWATMRLQALPPRHCSRPGHEAANCAARTAHPRSSCPAKCNAPYHHRTC